MLIFYSICTYFAIAVVFAFIFGAIAMYEPFIVDDSGEMIITMVVLCAIWPLFVAAILGMGVGEAILWYRGKAAKESKGPAWPAPEKQVSP